MATTKAFELAQLSALADVTTLDTTLSDELVLDGGSLTLDGGRNVQWGGAFGSGFPAVWGHSTNKQIKFAPDGNTSGMLYQMTATQLEVNPTTTSTTSTSGALVVAGGAGIAENLNVGGNAGVTGNLIVTGDLTVEGSQVSLNTTALDVEDKNITLNYHASNDTSASADGAGITIQDAVDASNDASILWDATDDKFDFSHSIAVTSTNPVLTLQDTDATVTYNRTEFQNSGGGLNLNTRHSNGTFVSTDYQIGKNASGAVEHKWFIGTTARSRITSAGDAEWYEDNSGSPQIGMHWDYADGRLGIGTDTPVDLLTIQSPASGGGNGITLKRNDNGTDQRVGAISFGNTEDDDLAVIAVKTSTGNNSDGNLEFYTQLDADNTPTKRMTIASDGKVGIGTDSPTATLEITSQIGANGGSASSVDYPLVISQEDIGNTIDQGIGAGVGILFKNATNSSSEIGSAIASMRASASDSNTSNELAFFISDNDTTLDEVVRIDVNGNVGIGTDDPDCALDVTRTTGWAEMHLDGAAGGDLILKDNGVSYGEIYAGNGHGLVVKSYASQDIYFLTNAEATAKMVIESGGNVGIGADPAVHKLDVDGAIATRQVRHSIRPSLNLDFANSKELDSRITFYRDSIATYYDSKGVLKYANVNEPRFDHDPLTGESKGLLIEEGRTNIFTYTNNPERWTLMSGGSSDPIANNIKSPDGTFNATSLIVAGSDPYFYQNNLTLSGTYTFSYWIKAVGNAIGKHYTTRITNVSTNSSTAGTLPSEWTRYTFTFTTGSTSTAYIGIEAPDSSPADGDEISIWGAQLELGAFATSLIPSDTRFTSRSSTATYHDETGILRTAPVNGARYGYKYDGRKWVETGLILENAGTNLVPGVTNGAWVFESGGLGQVKTINTRDTAAPDGSYTAVKCDVTALGSALTFSDFLYQPGQNWAGSTRTASMFVKGTAGETLSLKLDGAGGAGNYIDHTLTGNWDRISASYEYSSSYSVAGVMRVGPRALSGSATGTASVWYVWGAQLETGRAATSYIEGPANTTRAADVASSVAYTREQDTARMHDISWYNSKESTIYGEGTSITGDANVGSSPCLWGITDGTSSNRYLLRRNATGGDVALNRSGYTFRVVTPGFNNDYFPLYSVLPLWQDTEIHKMALSIKPNSQIAAADGIDAQMSSITMPEMDKVTMVEIGFAGSSTLWNGHIRKLSYYPAQLSLTELIALTENN